MQITANQLYHIYNQGNNREVIFREREDYILFQKKLLTRVYPVCDIVAYCLMPNHFHFLINADEKSAYPVKLGSIESTALANGFRLSCSAYANDFNKKYNRTGSLFRQKTKAKNLEGITPESQHNDYPFICFHYIHQNPMTAGLCTSMEDWEFSSFRDYNDLQNNSLIARNLAYELIGIDRKRFYEESYRVIDKDKIQNLFLK